jgi:hypothetical protein
MKPKKGKSTEVENLPIVLDKYPVPGRNERCPLHPEFKSKRCPHDCRTKFAAMRSSIAGDKILVSMADSEED